jgi:hypothetical protein
MEIYLLVIVTVFFIKLPSAWSNKSRSKHCNHKMNRIYVLLPPDIVPLNISDTTIRNLLYVSCHLQGMWLTR